MVKSKKLRIKPKVKKVSKKYMKSAKIDKPLPPDNVYCCDNGGEEEVNCG